jgi:hypothetical protein
MKLQIVSIFLMTASALSLYGQQVSSVTATPTFHNIGIGVQFDAATPADETRNVLFGELRMLMPGNIL